MLDAGQNIPVKTYWILENKTHRILENKHIGYWKTKQNTGYWSKRQDTGHNKTLDTGHFVKSK